MTYDNVDLPLPFGPHQRGNLPVPDSEIEIIEDFAPVDGDAEVFYFEHGLFILT